ncbi:MAG: ferrous iron transport protein A [Candidatus Aenigmatarchaeota archaeon]|nr:MAG: ferrous iron transport protein A [Candidatus Aenigmarchaeota archaeon]
MEIPITQLKGGEKGELKRIDGGISFRRKISSLNIRPGKMVRKVTSQPLRGPVVIEVDGRRLTIGRGMAMKIFVEVNR